MHPDIGDLIQGIKRSLADEILPAVSTVHAREQLTYTVFLCEHLATRWDRAHIYVGQTHDDLRATLAAALDIARACRRPSADLLEALAAVPPALASDEATGPQALRLLTVRVAELKGALVRLLTASAAADPSDHDILARLRETLRGYMKRELQRDEEWVSTAQIGWW